MNILEEYRNSDDKLQYFQEQDFDQQVEIVKGLSSSELEQILPNLSFGNVKRILNNLDNDKQKEIIGILPQQLLSAIYQNSTTDEKKMIVGLMEQKQAEHLKNLEGHNRSIMSSSDRIVKNVVGIVDAKDTIKNAKKEQKNAKKQIRINKRNVARIERLRKRTERKIGKLTIKSYVGIFKKRNLKKLQQAQQKLNDLNSSFDNINQQTSTLTGDIEQYKNIIKQEKQNIEIYKDAIKDAKNDVVDSVKKAKETRKASSKLGREEKKIFGRKVYRKNVVLRGHYLTTMKKDELERLRIESEKQAESKKAEKANQSENTEEVVVEEKKTEEVRNVSVNEEQKTEQKSEQETSEIEKETVEDKKTVVEEKKEDRKQNIQDVIDVIKMLAENGMIQYPSNVSLNSNNNKELMERPVSTVSASELISLSSVVQAVYKKGMQDAKKRQQQEVEEAAKQNSNIISFEQAKAKVKVRKRSAGLVNVTLFILILSIVVIIMGILLIINM